MVCFVIFVHIERHAVVEQGFPCFVRWQAGEFVWLDVGSPSCLSGDSIPSFPRPVFAWYLLPLWFIAC